MQEDLELAFQRGTSPRNLNGFYKGKVLLLLPQTPLEHVGQILSYVLLPWRGKYFNSQKNQGDNILQTSVRFFLGIYPKKIALGREEYGGFHAFPFQTRTTAGLQNAHDVLQLNYDLPENPRRIRAVTDELVEEKEKKRWLGKAFLKEKNTFRLVAFFALEK